MPINLQNCALYNLQNSTLDDILGIHPESGIFSSDESFNVTRVYRAEIPPLQALQVNKLIDFDLYFSTLIQFDRF